METIEPPTGAPEPALNEPEPSIPASSPIGLAAFLCLALFGLVYWAARPLVARIGNGGVEFLAYALLPLGITFTLLYRSAWHREMAVVKRTSYLMVTTGLILCSDLVLIGILLATLSIFIGLNRGNQ
jgi:hypothetical protein